MPIAIHYMVSCDVSNDHYLKRAQSVKNVVTLVLYKIKNNPITGFMLLNYQATPLILLKRLRTHFYRFFSIYFLVSGLIVYRQLLKTSQHRQLLGNVSFSPQTMITTLVQTEPSLNSKAIKQSNKEKHSTSA